MKISKKILILLLSFILSLSLIACEEGNSKDIEEDVEVTKDVDIEDDEDDKDSPDKDEENEDKDLEDEDKDNNNSKEEIADVNIYFVNKEYIETGNEDLDQLISEINSIDMNNNPEDQIIQSIISGPKDKDLVTAIPNTVNYLGVETKENTAFVNFNSEGLNGSSTEESLIINQIVASLLELDHINSVQFLVDGEVTESLMGHISIDQPLSKIQ